jgi:hypothetical protein
MAAFQAPMTGCIWAPADTLAAKQRAPRHVVARLVRGINRIFTGMLTTTERQIILATSGSYSQARVSRIEESFVEVEPRRGQKVALELRGGRLHFVVYLEPDVSVPLPLHLVRYEFLSRVAEGALPSSFSRECYEDMLAFKSQLLRQHHAVQMRYGDGSSSDANELNLRLLQLDARGLVSSRPIEVKL